jgi:hypothetical protein
MCKIPFNVAVSFKKGKQHALFFLEMLPLSYSKISWKDDVSSSENDIPKADEADQWLEVRTITPSSPTCYLIELLWRLSMERDDLFLRLS